MLEEWYGAASELLRALAGPIRLAIITRLASGPATVSELTVSVNHSQPLVSQHLRILRSAGLVHARIDGRVRIYELVDEHVAHIVADAIRHTAELNGDSPMTGEERERIDPAAVSNPAQRT